MDHLTRKARDAVRPRQRRLFAAALCTASLVAGHILFGQDVPNATSGSPSLLSQYRQAKNRITSDAANASQPVTSGPSTADMGRAAEALGSKHSPVSTDHSIQNPIPPLREKIQNLSSLPPAASSSASVARLVAARPFPLGDEASPAIARPSQVQRATKSATPGPLPISRNTSGEERLAPIVPAWAVPRPGLSKKSPVQPASAIAATARSLPTDTKSPDEPPAAAPVIQKTPKPQFGDRDQTAAASPVPVEPLRIKLRNQASPNIQSNAFGGGSDVVNR